MITAGEVLLALENFPYATIDQLIGGGPPLIIAPHADDESLGCGGLIAACTRRGTPPLVVIVTDGCGSHPASRTYPPARLRALREQEVRTAIQRLGGDESNIVFLGLPDTAVPTQGQLFESTVASMIRLLNDHGCRTILSPWRNDPHGDHVAVAMMAEGCARATCAHHLAYPVWGWALPADTKLPSEPVRGFRLDIAQYLAAKQAAIAAHASQYSGLISDDPTGFRLAPEFLAIFARPYEVFIET